MMLRAQTAIPWYRQPWLRFAVSALLLGVLLTTLDLDTAQWLESTQRVVWWPVVAALLLRPIAIWANAWRTSLILDSADTGLSLRDVWRASMFGEVLSRFVPGNLGTIAYVTKLSNSAGDALIAQVLDRVLFLVATLLAAALSLVLAGHALLGLLAGGALASVIVAARLAYGGLLQWVPMTSLHRGAVQRMLRRKTDWGGRFVLASAMALGLMTLLFTLLVVACGGQIGPSESLAAVTLVTIGTALPFSINGIGIREWVFVALLADNFPAKEALVTLAAMTYLLGFVSALVGLVTWALMRQKAKPADAQS